MTRGLFRLGDDFFFFAVLTIRVGANSLSHIVIAVDRFMGGLLSGSLNPQAHKVKNKTTRFVKEDARLTVALMKG